VAVTSVTTNNFISETTLFLRDDLLSNVTDPISAKRPSTSKWVATDYPHRDSVYPCITVKVSNAVSTGRMGAQSTLHWTTLDAEIRVWARTVKERDVISQDIINRLRTVDISLYVLGKLYGFEFTNVSNNDVDGIEGGRNKIINVQYKFVLGE